jgi:hypothetical protein
MIITSSTTYVILCYVIYIVLFFVFIIADFPVADDVISHFLNMSDPPNVEAMKMEVQG